jgi:hypothetical protein
MREKLKNISLLILLATYFVASNGMVLECTARWYSTSGQVAIALHSGPSKDLPIPTLTERRYLPQTSPVVILSVALLAHAVIYPDEHPSAFTWIDKAPPSYTAVLSAAVSNRAPPTASSFF